MCVWGVPCIGSACYVNSACSTIHFNILCALSHLVYFFSNLIKTFFLLMPSTKHSLER